MHESTPPDSDHNSETGINTESDTQFRPIDDLTLAEFLRQWLRAPRRASQDFAKVIAPNTHDEPLMAEVVTLPRGSSKSWYQRLLNLERRPIRLLLYLWAIIVAIVGNTLMVTSDGSLARRSEDVQLAIGMPFLLIALLIWLAGELVGHWPTLRQWWATQDRLDRFWLALRSVPILVLLLALSIVARAASVPPIAALQTVTPGVQIGIVGVLLWVALDGLEVAFSTLVERRSGLFPRWVTEGYENRKRQQAGPVNINQTVLPWYMRLDPMRLVYALAGMVSCVAVWFGSSGNRIATPTIYLWILSAVFWSLAFAPEPLRLRERVRKWWGKLHQFNWKSYAWVLVALALVMAFGIAFRFDRLYEHPREMTDDHVELILDAGLVRDGLRAIFFANNGGREPIQMYTIAAASYVPGLGIDHYTIKVVAAVQSLLTLPIFFWLGFEITGGNNRRLKLLMGVFVAALLATSYWHVAISRQALRIVLTPPITALLLIFLARAMRHNRRADYIIAGLCLGYGLYMYQAVRMLPIVIVLAIGMALYFSARSWRERRQYVFNLSVLVLISFVVFLPLFHYSVEQPELFWRRTTGRLLGDDVITETLADGTIRQREASVEERLQAFQNNVPVLLSNVRNVLLMFNWKGDVAAITGVPNTPALDPFSGALFIVGLGAWSVYAIRRRDVVLGLVPIGLFIMLLPSALSIAFPVENPSHTRTSGAIPFAYLIMALPLAVIVDQMWRQDRVRKLIAVGLSGFVILASYDANTRTYFGDYPQVYSDSFDPYTEPGRFLEGFANSNGSYGNAFMIGFPHWWSHRAIGLAGGLETYWPNGIVSRDAIPEMLEAAALRNDAFRLDPNKDLLFFYSPDDVETGQRLQALFPEGREARYQTYARNNDFMWYMVPALGTQNLTEWLIAPEANALADDTSVEIPSLVPPSE